MENPRTKLGVAAAVAAAFLVLAIGGSILTSRHMNRTADEQAMSAGRPGDQKPNLIQERTNGPTLRSPTTSGANPDSSVPPASR